MSAGCHLSGRHAANGQLAATQVPSCTDVLHWRRTAVSPSCEGIDPQADRRQAWLEDWGTT